MKMKHTENLKVKSIKIPKGPQFSGSLKNKLFTRAFIGLLLLLCAGFATKEIYQELCHSDFFQITAMEITGNRMASKEQITVLSKVDIYSNLLTINAAQVKSLLESHPWIARADVTRDWPNRLLIIIKEKTPVALLRRNSGLFFLDNKGHIIAAATSSQELDFPVITGLENFNFNSTQSTQTPGILQETMGLLKLASRNNSILPEQNISEIHINKNGQLILYLLERPFPIHMGADRDIKTRYYRLVKVLRDLYKTKEFSKVSYIRLDYQDDTILVGKTESDSRHRG